MVSSAPTKQKTAKQFTVRLTPEELKALKKLAKSQEITATSALRKAIATEKYLKEQEAKGGKVLIQEKDGTMKEVVFR